MADVIGLPSLARLRELEAENERLRTELAEAKAKNARADTVYGLTRFQLNDLLSEIAAWRKALDQVQENVLSVKLMLPEG